MTCGSSSGTFRRMLLHDQGLVIGRYDGRNHGPGRGSGGRRRPDSTRPFTGNLWPVLGGNERLCAGRTSSSRTICPYEILAGVGPWNYDGRNSLSECDGPACRSDAENPYLRVRCWVVCAIWRARWMGFARAWIVCSSIRPTAATSLRRIRFRPHDVCQPAGLEEDAGELEKFVRQ